MLEIQNIVVKLARFTFTRVCYNLHPETCILHLSKDKL